MKRYFIKWMLVAFFAISNLQAATLQPRIIGGADADPGEWPATVALLQASTYESQTSNGVSTGEAQFNSRFCGGALVAPGWVITAAHCMFHNGVEFQPGEILALAGVTSLIDAGQFLSVSQIIIHPDFNANSFESDIALLQLSAEAIAPAEVLHLFEGTPDVGSNATVVGWGLLANRNYPTVLQEVEVQVVSNDSCNAATSYNGVISDNMLCASAPGKDSCGGDSGGPLMAAQDGEFHQIGIVSFGKDCAAPDFPGVYTRVEGFQSWITAHINLPPTALPQYVITDEDTAVAITLNGSDPDGDPLTYSVFTQPDYGQLSGSAANLTYTPDSGYNGADSFTFQVNDGSLNSDEETVSIAVNGVNDAPVAQPQTVITDEDTTVQLTLTGLDPDGDPLSFTVLTDPASGQLTATLPDLSYTPNPDFNGSDSFTFIVDDGNIFSAPETVSLIVNAVNDPPTANPQIIVTDENTAVTFTLTGQDPDDDRLTFLVVTEPVNGLLSGVEAEIIYTPGPDFNGSDSFTFVVDDGNILSAPETVSLIVNAVNNPPTANPQIIVTDENTAVAFTLTGQDPDDDRLTFFIVTEPANGLSSGVGAEIIYTPNPDFNGSDSFSFQVSDGLSDSAPVNITMTVNAAPDLTSKTSGGGGSFNVFLLLAGMFLLSRRKSTLRLTR